MSNDLNDVFNDDIDDVLAEQAELTAEEAKQEDSQEESQEPTDSKSDEEVAEPKELEGENQESDEPPASTDDKDTKSEPEESWTKTAVLDERRKRQELERKIQELETKFNQPAPQEQAKEEDVIPDPIDDPVGYKNYVKDSLKQEMFLERVEETKAEMQAKHEDYPEMANKFMELCKENPALDQKVRQASNPAKFAYDTAKKYLDSQKYSDPDYLTNLKEEMKKEILADLVKNQKTNSKPAPNVDIPDLSNRTSVESNVTQKEVFKGDVNEFF